MNSSQRTKFSAWHGLLSLAFISILVLSPTVAPAAPVVARSGLGDVASNSASVPSSGGSPCLIPSPSDYSTLSANPSLTNVSLSGHVIPAVRDGKAVYLSKLSQANTLQMELVFAIRNLPQFQACKASISDPHSPNYGHFLNATSLQPYIPTPGQKDSAISFLSHLGFMVSEGASPLVVVINAPVAVVEKTFGVTINVYRASSVTFYAPDADPRLPQNFAGMVVGILGLDNYSVARPLQTGCGYFARYPDCPQGIQVGYSLSNLYASGYDGTGQKVAIVDVPGDPNIQTAINTYDSEYGLPATTINILYPDGPPSSYDPGWASETAMDVEAVHSVAPGAGITLLYDSVDLLNAIDYVASNHIATIVSNSWGYWCGVNKWCDDVQLPPSLVSAVDARLALDASQGLTILFASGDKGAKPDGTNVGTEFPASDPNVLAVGATNLYLANCNGTTCGGYGTEDGASISGGGYSGYFAEPSWQTSTLGSRPGRAVPDVSMFGYKPYYWVYSTYSDKCGQASVPQAGWFGCAGTSLSTPLWAGFLAVALQVRGGGSFGNIDPLIYQLGAGASYSSIFHDITSGSNGYYSAGTGWDPVTGWGSPIANTLATSLAYKQVTTDKSTYAWGDTLYYTGTGFTANGPVWACLSTDNAWSLVCYGEPNADSYGNVAGSTLVGPNTSPGPQKFYVKDLTTNRFSSPVQLTILPSVTQPLTVTVLETGAPTGTYTVNGCSPSPTTGSTGTTTSFTMVSSCSFTISFANSGGVRWGFISGGVFSATSGTLGPTCSSGTCSTISVNADYQVLLTVNGGNGVTYSAPSETSDGWYNYGDSLTVSSDGIWGRSSGTGTRLASWNLDGGSNTNVAQATTFTTTTATMTAAHTVNFNPATQYQITFVNSPSGGGTSTATTSPTISGDTGWYDAGTSVQILATPNSGYTFTSWTGTGGGGSSTLTLDGSGSGGCSSSTLTICAVVLTTTNTNDVIMLFVYRAAGSTPYTISDTAGLTWHARSISGSPPASYTVYYAIASSKLSTDIITASLPSSPETLQMVAFAVSGANTASPFDSGVPSECSNRGTVAAGGTISCSITTNHANDMVIGFAEEVQAGGLAPGSGYTQIASTTASGIGAAEHKIVSSAGTYSISWRNSASSSQNIGVTGDAIIAGTTGSYTGTNNPATVTMNAAIQETATFTTTTRSTSTTVTPSTISETIGNISPVTFTATVADTSPGTPSAPTGTVTWNDGGKGGTFTSTTCTLSPATSSSSMCTVTYTPSSSSAAGTIGIAASYSGDGSHGTSPGSGTITINKRSTSTTITPSSLTATHGALITFTATVKDTSPGAATSPTGTVTWRVSWSTGTVSCTLTASGPGTSTCSVTGRAPATTGFYTITATYNGDSTHSTSSGTSSLTVT